MRLRQLLLAPTALGLLALAGCSTANLAVHLAKSITEETTPAGSTETRPLPSGTADYYKLGSPYRIKGTWYYPSYDPHYDRTGVASWYGPKFHGRRTANGERFDMNEVSAAHPTLPLPSRVRVTNLENGRQLVVRVNDRGPFIDNRLIDLSRRGAQLLGFYRKGLARVRVEYIGLDQPLPDAPLPADRPIRFAAADTPVVAFKPRPQQAQTRAEATPPVRPNRSKGAGAGSSGGSSSGTLLVEAAVLDKRDAAVRLGDLVRSFGDVVVEPERRGGRLVYAVRIGPIGSNREAAAIVAELTRAGLTQSHIVAAGYR